MLVAMFGVVVLIAVVVVAPADLEARVAAAAALLLGHAGAARRPALALLLVQEGRERVGACHAERSNASSAF